MRKFHSTLVLLAIFTSLISCKKSKSDDQSEPAITGFWKGSTTPLQTSSAYAMGFVLHANGKARSYIYYGGETLPTDTSSASVLKVDGSYTSSGTTVLVSCVSGSELIYQGVANSAFTAMEGTLTFGEVGGVLYNNLDVSMNK